jgi:hypothetical protein
VHSRSESGYNDRGGKVLGCNDDASILFFDSVLSSSVMTGLVPVIHGFFAACLVRGSVIAPFTLTSA